MWPRNPTPRHTSHVLKFHSVIWATIFAKTLFVIRAGNRGQFGLLSLVKGCVEIVDSHHRKELKSYTTMGIDIINRTAWPSLTRPSTLLGLQGEALLSP